RAELPVSAADASKRRPVRSAHVVHANDPVVARIRDVDMILAVHGDAIRGRELPDILSQRPVDYLVLAGYVVYAYDVVVILVGDIDPVLAVHGDTRWPPGINKIPQVPAIYIGQANDALVCGVRHIDVRTVQSYVGRLIESGQVYEIVSIHVADAGDLIVAR